jgi:hypothetical protein
MQTGANSRGHFPLIEKSVSNANKAQQVSHDCGAKIATGVALQHFRQLPAPARR